MCNEECYSNYFPGNRRICAIHGEMLPSKHYPFAPEGTDEEVLAWVKAEQDKTNAWYDKKYGI